MPAKSAAQKRLMDAAAHNPAFAKKVGIPSKVAKEFSSESKGMTFKKGSDVKKVKKMMNGGMARPAMPAQSNAGGAMRGLDRAAAMSGRTMPATGRPVGMKAGGLSAGHKSADGIASKGKTKGKQVAMKKGGKVCK